MNSLWVNTYAKVRWVILFNFLLSTLALAQIQQQSYERPVLSVRISPAEPYVQEQIIQSVSLTSTYPFEELYLDFPSPSNTTIVTLIKPRNRKYATYGFDGYLYETTRALFPQSSGTFIFDPVVITGSIRLPDGVLVPFRRSSQANSVLVAPKPNSFKDEWWLIARALQIEQEYSQPLNQLRVGDIVQRRVTLTADGVTAEQLPIPTLRRTRYMTIFPGELLRNTRISAEGVSATLVQHFDLQIDEENLIDFAPITIPWWDAEADSRQLSAVVAARVEPLPKDTAALVARLMSQAELSRSQGRSGLLTIAISIAGVIVLVFFILLSLWHRNKAVDRKLKQALRNSGTPLQTMSAVHDWILATNGIKRPTKRQLDLLFSPDTVQQLVDIQLAAFGSGQLPKSDLQILANNITASRRLKVAGGRVISSSAIANFMFGRSVSLPSDSGGM